jgi:hypothetical protein
MWHAWVYDEPIGRYGTMATDRDAAEGELGERVHWARHDKGDRWEAWSHQE